MKVIYEKKYRFSEDDINEIQKVIWMLLEYMLPTEAKVFNPLLNKEKIISEQKRNEILTLLTKLEQKLITKEKYVQAASNGLIMNPYTQQIKALHQLSALFLVETETEEDENSEI